MEFSDGTALLRQRADRKRDEQEIKNNKDCDVFSPPMPNP